MFDINVTFKKNIIPIIVLILLFIFAFLSFYEISYNGKLAISLKDEKNIFFIVIASTLLLCFVGFIVKYLFNNSIFNKERMQYSYVIDIDEKHRIIIKQGDISSYEGDNNKVILLPANTSFDEKCITDNNSALGSYFRKNYPDRIDNTRKKIIEEARIKFSLSTEKKCADVGDTILLSNYDGEKVNILISAVTQDNPDIGIQADSIGILSSIKKAISLCSENRYSSITMPIIGTGHGGMKPNISLMLICIQYFLSVYHSQNHHVRELSIIVFDQGKRLKNDIDEAVVGLKKLISKKGK
jgi:O-acetyl-ADP-ribose deacetylase (regulator of RNase III)